MPQTFGRSNRVDVHVVSDEVQYNRFEAVKKRVEIFSIEIITYKFCSIIRVSYLSINLNVQPANSELDCCCINYASAVKRSGQDGPYHYAAIAPGPYTSKSIVR